MDTELIPGDATTLEVGYQPKYFEANLDELAACADSDRRVSATGSVACR
jgi:hypothetical protein